MAMRVRRFLYKNGSCLFGNDGLAFQADRIEEVMLMDDMTLAQLKQNIRDRLKMGRGEEICNVTYRMPMALCPLRFGELNLCDHYSVAIMFECFRDNTTNLNGVELLVQTVLTSIAEFDLNVSQVIDEGGPSMVDSAIIEVPPTNVCGRASSSRRNPAFGESRYQGTVYESEDEGKRRDPDFVPSNIPDTSSEGDLEASGCDASDDDGIDEGSDDDGMNDGEDDEGRDGDGHDYNDDVGEVGGGDGLPNERFAAFYDQIDMEAQAGPEFPKDVLPSMENPLFVVAMFDSKDALRHAVKMYSIRHHRNYTVFKSKATFVDCRCKWYNNPCKWRMRARERDYYWEITWYFGPHTCITLMLTQDNPKMDSSFITSCILPDVIETPDIHVSAMIDRIRVMFNTTVKAFGNWNWSYAIMPRWLKATRHFNPGSVVVWEHMPHPDATCFHRVFWTFAPCIATLCHLKPILQIDGTFLHQGILNVVHDKRLMWHPPYAENVYCVRHLSSNLNKAYKNAELKKLFVETGEYFVTQSTIIDVQLRVGRLFSEKVTEDLERLTDLASRLRVRKPSITLASTSSRHVHLLTHPSRLTLTMCIIWRQCVKHIVAEGETSNTQKADGNGLKGASRKRATYTKTMWTLQTNGSQAWVMPKSRELRAFIFVSILMAFIVMVTRRDHINPGLEDMSLLTQQQNHISERIWNGDV
ncbi:uncharacterized protein G2W53_037296 [Senna tora]|uniref:Transposase MuDR plant domain-containing protein n=1 Tax=Senna tora TaxID=362788 RepID=A0A834SW01_9FABA|nr:uncharacterized protein G2W53_037296 [Senna tora]